MKRILGFLFAVLFAVSAKASQNGVKHVFIIMFENVNVGDVQRQPTFGAAMKQGAFLADYHALVHPSQANYFALVAGDTLGVEDNDNHDLKGQHLGDLLEAKGLNWKAYVENWPGECFAGATKTRYVRKHNPFISFVNVQKDKTRCNQHIVDASQLDTDIANGSLPEYSFYVPNLDNYADKWLSKAFGQRFKDPKFMDETVVALTFDENDVLKDRDQNCIYTVLLGPSVQAGARSSKRYTHYSLLSTVEKIFDLGHLGRNDATAPTIDDVWK